MTVGNLPPARPRIYGILDKLLDYRGGSLNDFASCDLVGDPVSKESYFPHGLG